MLLRRLVLRNFGLYRGEQVFDLVPRVRDGIARPVILVGGQNGAGKTTVLDAVRLCLFGRLALGGRTTEGDYHAYLRDHIYRGREVVIPVTYASVAMEFDYAHAGRQSTYSVNRSWEARGAASVVETLKVMRDGLPLTEVDSQFWSEFVRSLVPPGVAQLFFFDGEKIKRLAEEASEAETLAESIKALLGLDLVERLKADLDLYSSRSLKKSGTRSLASRLGEIESAAAELKSESCSLAEHEVDCASRLSELAVQLERTEERLAQGGEGLAAQRGDLRGRKAVLEGARSQEEAILRELCEGPLPFAFCPQLSARLLEQLARESSRARWELSRLQLTEAFSAVRKRLMRKEVALAVGWKASTRSAVIQEIEGVARDLALLPPELSQVEKVHGAAGRLLENAERTLLTGVADSMARIREHTLALSRTVEALRDLQGQLNRVPQGDELAPIIRELSRLQEEHATVTLELALKTEQRGKSERELDALLRERDRIIRSQEESHAATSRVALAGVARRALEEYLVRLTVAKVDELQVAALRCFHNLSRKTDLVHDLRIDPSSFEVVLLNGAGQEIPKAGLSAGEKQIYAISLLWALAQVSGRALPMIVDTPLGRLDSVHRRHLLERYFPFASHQVIVLSTDTEVDRDNLTLLEPFISHAIHLRNHDGWTEATVGYFWKDEAANVGIAAEAP